MLLNSHISVYARCSARKVCGLVRSTWGTSRGEGKLGARDKILSTKVARRANIRPCGQYHFHLELADGLQHPAPSPEIVHFRPQYRHAQMKTTERMEVCEHAQHYSTCMAHHPLCANNALVQTTTSAVSAPFETVELVDHPFWLGCDRGNGWLWYQSQVHPKLRRKRGHHEFLSLENCKAG